MQIRIKSRVAKRESTWLLPTQSLHNRVCCLLGDVWLMQTDGGVLEDADQSIQRPFGLGKPQRGTNNKKLQYKFDAHCGKSANLLKHYKNLKTEMASHCPIGSLDNTPRRDREQHSGSRRECY